MRSQWRWRLTATIAAVAGIVSLTFALAAPPNGLAAVVDFTPDGKLRRPVDHRAGFALSDEPPGRGAGVFSPDLTKEGEITRPTDDRDTFQYIGIYAVATKPGRPIDEMHVVYTRPADVQAYRQDGRFPDGAVLVKEITRVETERLPTGQSHREADVKVWFVMIEDAMGRFPGNELWDDGWGWALFEADQPSRNVATDHETDSKTCHIPARKDDWVRVRGYPALMNPVPVSRHGR